MRKELLSDSSPSSEPSDSEDGGASLDPHAFTVNESFARKFEHNKKREELQRLEEKLGKPTGKRKRNDDDETDRSDSTSEAEDEGELATEALDSEIIATINAIRSKDPRVYDESATFYKTLDDESATKVIKSNKDKPMRLQDYHRENLLKSVNGADEGDEDKPMTYHQEQDALKRSIVGEINAAAAAASGSSDEEAEPDTTKDFLVSKPSPKFRAEKIGLDVENADKDPETFLSNFMSSRAWAVPTDRDLKPFDSDDSEDEKRADEFEEAYNFRFEDPTKANEKLRSHARDVAAKFSVRREGENPRQKKRDREKERRDEEKRVVQEEKARLRKLRIEALEEKVHTIQKAAGLRGANIEPDDWSRLLDDEWDDVRWEEEMEKRFGEKYYADEDVESEADADITKKRKKVRKPKFDIDIDIKDIVPDFEDSEKAYFSFSDEDMADAHAPQPKESHKKVKAEKQRQAKRERRLIEQLVDDQLQLEFNHSLPKASATAAFRYRETSPRSFGLTARDILLAEDSALNEFAGLKKLAAFRDAEKKEKDKRYLGKKGRLRRWRKETFGDEEGMQGRDLVPVQAVAADGNEDELEVGSEMNIVTDGKKKKRRRSKKKAKIEIESA